MFDSVATPPQHIMGQSIPASYGPGLPGLPGQQCNLSRTTATYSIRFDMQDN